MQRRRSVVVNAQQFSHLSLSLTIIIIAGKEFWSQQHKQQNRRTSRHPQPGHSLTTSVGHHRQFVLLYGYYTGRFQQRLNLADNATPFDLRRGNPESHVRFHSEPAILPGPASQPGPFQRFGFIQNFRREKTRK